MSTIKTIKIVGDYRSLDMKRLVLLTIGLLVLGLLSVFSDQSHPSLYSTCFTLPQSGETGPNRPAVDSEWQFFTLETITPQNASKVTQIDAWEHNYPISSALFGSNGNFLGWGDSSTIYYFDLFSREVSVISLGEQLVALIALFTPNEELLVGGVRTNKLENIGENFSLWDNKTNYDIMSIPLSPREIIEDIKYSPNENCVALASSYGKIRMWSIPQRVEFEPLAAQNQVTTIAFSSNGKNLVYGTDGDNDSSGDVVIGIWNLENSTEEQILRGHDSSITRVIYSPSENYIASSSWDKTIRIWSLDTGNAEFILNGHTDGVTDIAFNEDGNLLASVGRDATLRLWDAKNGQEIAVFDADNALISVSFCFTAHCLITVDNKGVIQYWGIPE